MWPGIVFQELAGQSMKETLSGCQHALFQILHVTFSISGAIIGVHIAHATGTNTPP